MRTRIFRLAPFLVVLSIFLIQGLPQALAANATIYTSSTSTTGFGSAGGTSQLTWYANGRYWAAFDNSSGGWALYTSTTGTSWTDSTGLINSESTYPYFAMYVDSSNNIYYVGCCNSGSFVYRYGALQSGGTVSWTISQQSWSPAGSSQWQYPTIAATSPTNIWIGYFAVNSGTYTTFAYLCTSTCGTSSNFVQKLSATEGADGAVYPMAIFLSTSSKLAITYEDGTTGKVSVQTTSNDGTSFSSAVTSSTAYSPGYYDCISQTTDTIYCASRTLSSYTHVDFFKFALGGGSWTESGSVVTASNAYQQPTTITSDSSGNLYIVWVDSTTVVDYTKSSNSGSSWGSATNLSTDTGIRTALPIFGVTASTYPNLIGASYSTLVSTNYFIQFGYINLTSTINLTCILKESGATSETLTLSGGSPSPSTAGCSTGSGTTTAVTVTPSCTLTATVATDGANTRYRFNSSATSSTTQNITCPATGSSSVTIWNYYQLQQAYQASTNGAGPPTWDSGLSDPVTGTVTGVSLTTICTISPSSGTTSTASCSGWADYNTAVTNTIPMTGAGTHIQWEAGISCSWADITGGNTHTCAFYKQLQNTYQVTANAATNFVNGLSWPVSGTFLGLAGQTECTITSTVASTDSCTTYFDYDLAVTIPQTATGAVSNTRWQYSAACAFTQTSGGNTNNCNMYLQLQNTYQMDPTNPTTWDAGYSELATGSLYGSSGQTICTITLSMGGGTAGCTGYADSNAQVSLSSGFTCTCSPAGTWTPSGTYFWTDTTGGNTHTADYVIIYGSGFILKLTANQSGAPHLTFTVSGCSASPGTVVADGNPHTFMSSGSCTVTVQRVDSPKDRIEFTGTTSNSQSFTVVPGTTYSYTFNYQNYVTFASTSPSTSTTNPSGSAWYNFGTTLTMSVTILPNAGGFPSGQFKEWTSNSSDVIACVTCQVTSVTLNGGGDPLAIVIGVTYLVVQPNPFTVTFWFFPMIITTLFVMIYLLVATRHGATTWARNYMLVTGVNVGMIMALLTETMPFPVLILGLLLWFFYAYRG